MPNTLAGVEAPSELTILLVDDRPSVRFGLQLLFELEMDTLDIWEAGSSTEALTLAANMRPDLVFMDVQLPDRDGISATAQMTELWPHCLVIILTLHDRPEIRSLAMAAGAWAFVEKGNPEDVRFIFKEALRVLGRC